MRPHLTGLDAARFSHGWRHPDAGMDRLQQQVAEIVRRAAIDGEASYATVARVRAAAAGDDPTLPIPSRFPPARAVAAPPRLTEPWFC